MLPQEIENKIKLYLSNPCADIIKKECISLRCVKECLKLKANYVSHYEDTRLNFVKRYFAYYSIFCD